MLVFEQYHRGQSNLTISPTFFHPLLTHPQCYTYGSWCSKVKQREQNANENSASKNRISKQNYKKKISVYIRARKYANKPPISYSNEFMLRLAKALLNGRGYNRPTFYHSIQPSSPFIRRTPVTDLIEISWFLFQETWLDNPYKNQYVPPDRRLKKLRSTWHGLLSASYFP